MIRWHDGSLVAQQINGSIVTSHYVRLNRSSHASIVVRYWCIFAHFLDYKNTFKSIEMQHSAIGKTVGELIMRSYWWGYINVIHSKIRNPFRNASPVRLEAYFRSPHPKSNNFFLYMGTLLNVHQFRIEFRVGLARQI